MRERKSGIRERNTTRERARVTATQNGEIRREKREI